MSYHMRKYVLMLTLSVLLAASTCALYSQAPGKGKVAVIQATALPNQDLFMVEYDPLKVRSGVSAPS